LQESLRAADKRQGNFVCQLPPTASSALTRVWKNNALSIVLTALFLGSVTLQVYFGQAVYNEQRLEAGSLM